MRSPYTPGVGLEPGFLAGREGVIVSYRSMLMTQNIGKNMLIAGLRGVGKSVLLKRLAAESAAAGWVPVLREMTKRNNHEEELVRGLLAEIALRLKGVTISRQQQRIGIGAQPEEVAENLDLEHLVKCFQGQPGDMGDKLLQTIKYISGIVAELKYQGLVFLFDEFQVLEDSGDHFSLSLILDMASRLQSSTSCPVHFVLAGLPTLQGKVIEAKPHAERLFQNVVTLGALENDDCRKAITEPLRLNGIPTRFATDLIETLVQETAGYPYFIQYFSNVAFSTFEHSPVTCADFETILPEVYAQLDEAFFAGRLFPLTGKERAVTLATAKIPAPFTPTQVLDALKLFGADVSMGAVQQYLLTLQAKNIIYRVRRGAYDYALPLFGRFLLRCLASEDPGTTLREVGQA
jgi:hypothetical protein